MGREIAVALALAALSACEADPLGLADAGADGGAAVDGGGALPDAGLTVLDSGSGEADGGGATPDGGLSAPDATPGDSGVVSEDCITDPSPGQHVFQCGGHDFNVSVPAACARGCGLITDVHGLTMSGRMMENNTGLAALGEQYGYVVIQPNANPRPPLSAWLEADDDVVYDFIQRAERVYQSDPLRIHFTGFSQGGFMSWRFICKHADHFASIAPAAAGTPCPLLGPDMPGCDFSGGSAPAAELDVLYMHGTQEENYIPYTCAQSQIAGLLSYWGMSFSATVSMDAMHVRRRYTNARGTVFEHLAHDYYSDAEVVLISATRLGGHCFPGSTDPGNEPGQLFSFKCEQPSAFTWGVEVMRFFMDHPHR